MTYSVIIPARYASQRLPGKPLLDLHGLTMIERVYKQAMLSNATRVVVATDHADIEKCVKDFGGDVVMTRSDHTSGTDRLAEVVSVLEFSERDIVVNVQGDEPLIPPQVIDQVANNLRDRDSASVATVSEPIQDSQAYLDPNTVKVVSDKSGLALYFSRAPIPWNRDLLSTSTDKDEQLRAFLLQQSVQKHVGIYAYRCSLLKQFSQWPISNIEEIEKLEQLRILAHGHRIHVEPANAEVPGGIDTPADLEKVRDLLSAESTSELNGDFDA